jgi:hypothetical protein
MLKQVFKSLVSFMADESGAVNVQQLHDLAAWTRATEYRKGGYVSLTEPLPDYPFFNALVEREIIRSTPTIRYQVMADRDNSFEITQAGEPVAISIPKHAKTVSMNWAKARTKWAYLTDEEAFNGAGEDQIIDVVTARKVEHDSEFRRNLEVKLNDNASEPTKNDIIGIKDWLPADTTATDLELNGGADVVYGVTGVEVATTPRWGHAVCGFDQLADDDLFQKLSEFMHRSKYFVPEGARTIDPAAPQRCILVNHKIFTRWEELQTLANDDLRNDLGLWRGAVNFRSVPVKINHAQSEPDSPATPDGHALVYMLDLNTWALWIHPDFNFLLSEPVKDPNVPGQVKMWRELYCQLACTNREKNLVAYTTTAEFLI